MGLRQMIDDKRRYRRYRARVKQLPGAHRTAIEALQRYLTYSGAITDGDTMMVMFEDLAELFEHSVADSTPVRAIVGDDPVEFADAFLRNYAEGQWINAERQRLTTAIDDVAGDAT